MRIAIPLQHTVCAPHFGGSEQLAILDVDDASQQIRSEQFLDMPEHAPGVYPRFILEQQIDLVIAGGIGERAVIMLADGGVRTLSGAPALKPSELVRQYLKGQLLTDDNPCAHTHGRQDGHGPHGQHYGCHG